MNTSDFYYDRINKPFFIWQQRSTCNSSMPANHYHDAYEVYYLLEGSRYYFIKDRTYLVSKGDLVVININDLHKTLDSGAPSHSRILINFKKEFIGSILKDAPDIDLFSCFNTESNVIKLGIAEQNLVESILFKMLSEYKKRGKGSNTYEKLLLTELLIIINRLPGQAKAPDYKYLNPLHKKISEIVQYVNNNYYCELNLKRVSECFFISPYYLSRSFKEVTGFTFTEYINSVRTKEAQRLLRETKNNISQIAEKVGYESTTHFGRVFKSIIGMSPLKYRKNTDVR